MAGVPPQSPHKTLGPEHGWASDSLKGSVLSPGSEAGVPGAVLGTVPGTSGLSLQVLCPASLSFVLLPDPRSYLALDSEPRAAVGSKFKW